VYLTQNILQGIYGKIQLHLKFSQEKFEVSKNKRLK